mmetsp:Transcript_19623/g.66210  ORF Transcript_19623/g.66210 Transcript_19623/m.66210 type:complete len:480 (+) Transcript_19623:44-1483(+)
MPHANPNEEECPPLPPRVCAQVPRPATGRACDASVTRDGGACLRRAPAALTEEVGRNVLVRRRTVVHHAARRVVLAHLCVKLVHHLAARRVRLLLPLRLRHNSGEVSLGQVVQVALQRGSGGLLLLRVGHGVPALCRAARCGQRPEDGAPLPLRRPAVKGDEVRLGVRAAVRHVDAQLLRRGRGRCGRLRPPAAGRALAQQGALPSKGGRRRRRRRWRRRWRRQRRRGGRGGRQQVRRDRVRRGGGGGGHVCECGGGVRSEPSRPRVSQPRVCHVRPLKRLAALGFHGRGGIRRRGRQLAARVRRRSGRRPHRPRRGRRRGGVGGRPRVDCVGRGAGYRRRDGLAIGVRGGADCCAELPARVVRVVVCELGRGARRRGSLGGLLGGEAAPAERVRQAPFGEPRRRGRREADKPLVVEVVHLGAGERGVGVEGGRASVELRLEGGPRLGIRLVRQPRRLARRRLRLGGGEIGGDTERAAI